MAQAERIDALQRAMNAARFNPLAFNPEVSRFNYEIMQASQDGLLAECWAKLPEINQKEGQRMKVIVEKFLELNPIVTKRNDEHIINRENYKKFLKIIDAYEKLNKVFLDITDLNSPSRDEEDDDEL